MRLAEMYAALAAEAAAKELPIDDSPNGVIHQFIAARCTYRPGTEFFIVTGVCSEMADIDARKAGFRDQLDRAAHAIGNAR